MDDKLTYYDLLGLSPDATQEEIESARKEHIKALHPDRHPENIRPVMDQQLKRINHAADTLIDPQERAAYDERLKSKNNKNQSSSEEDYYEPEDMRDFYERAEEAWAAWEEWPGYDEDYEAHDDDGGGWFEESPAYARRSAAPPRPTVIPEPVYEKLVDPPGAADKLAATVAYGLAWLLIAGLWTAPLGVGGTVTIISALLGFAWALVIPIGAFLITSSWAKSSLSPVRMAGGALAGFFGAMGNLFFTGRLIFTPLAWFVASSTGPVDDSIRSGILALEQRERAVAVIKVLWRGPLAIFALGTVTTILGPVGGLLLLVVCLAALAWCAGRMFVLWGTARQGQIMDEA